MQPSRLLKDVSEDTAIEDLPVKLLESLIPGFGFVRRFLIASIGFDITILVTGCFILFALVSSMKYIGRYLTNFIEQYLSSTVTITSSDKLHEEVMQWIAKQHVTENARTLSASTRLNARLGRSGGPSPSDISATFHYGDLFASTPPIFSPYFGTHYFWHKGRLFLLKRSKSANANSVNVVVNQGGDDDRETIAISCLGRSSQPIKDLLQLCKRDHADQRRSMTTIRYPALMRGPHWQTATTRPSRSVDTVYLDQSIKEELLKDVYEFLHPSASQFYASRGIPYRRGFLFYGPPGTGKTSLSLALAGIFGLELHVLSLVEAAMTDQRLSVLFSNLPSRCIVLLEDVDAAGLRFRRSTELGTEANSTKDDNKEPGGGGGGADPGRRRPRATASMQQPNEPAGEVSLSGLLNALDGVASQEGRILIMTTNDPESLDKALIRPGRVDMQVYFGYLDKPNARQIFTRMYTKDADESTRGLALVDKDGVNPSSAVAKSKSNAETSLPAVIVDSEKPLPELAEMAAEFADALPENVFTPAEVQGFLLTRRKSPRKALEEVEAWRDRLLAAKARGTNVLREGGEGGKEELEETADGNGGRDGVRRRGSDGVAIDDRFMAKAG